MLSIHSVKTLALSLLLGAVLSTGCGATRRPPASPARSSSSSSTSSSHAPAARAVPLRAPAFTAKQANQAANLLRRSQWAQAHVTWEGRELTITWTDGHTESAMANVARDGMHERRDYLAPKTLAGRTWLSDGKQVRIYNPRTKRLVISPQGTMSALNLPLLFQNYQVVLDPKTHMTAERSCRILRLQPRHGGKPHRVLWLDAATAVTLKHERYHADGSPASITQFNDIKIGGVIPSSRFHPRFPAQQVRRTEPEGDERWEGDHNTRSFPPSRLHSGYRVQKCSDAPYEGIRCAYTDGVDLLSVYSLPLSSPPPALHGEKVNLGHTTGTARAMAHQWAVSWIAERRQWVVIVDSSRDLALQIARGIVTR